MGHPLGGGAGAGRLDLQRDQPGEAVRLVGSLSPADRGEDRIGRGMACEDRRRGPRRAAAPRTERRVKEGMTMTAAPSVCSREAGGLGHRPDTLEGS